MKPHETLGPAAEIFGVEPAALTGRSRSQHVAWARQALMWALPQRYAGLSSLEIGRLLHKDHSTVLYGQEAAERRRESDPRYAALCDQLLAAIQPPAAALRPAPGPRELLREADELELLAEGGAA